MRVVDEDTLENCYSKLEEIRCDLEELSDNKAANEKEIAELHKQRDEINKFVARVTNKQGKPRVTSDELDARRRIKRTFESAKDQLIEKGLKKFASHLETHVRDSKENIFFYTGKISWDGGIRKQ